MEAYTATPWYRAGRASDLQGRDRALYRMLELLPGMLSWGTILLAVFLSYTAPLYAAIFIIAFDLYWLLKTAYLSAHLRHNWKRLQAHMRMDWKKELEGKEYGHLYHMVILPYYKEGSEIVEKSIETLASNRFDPKKIIVVVAGEARAGALARETGERAVAKYKNAFHRIILTIHPEGLPHEIPGKGSNIAYAAKEAGRILKEGSIPEEHVIVSAFDIDTMPYPDYFFCLTWHYLSHPDPLHASFQPVPVFNNNIWDAPALSRVAAMSATFWQMIQQERPEKLATFSSHAVSYKTLSRIDFWQRNIVSEDSRIFWNALIAFDGNYEVVPISYPVSMDANLAPTFIETAKNIYRQQRRWAWGVENVPYILFNFIKNKKIPRWKRLRMAVVQVEGFWSLATNPIMIFLLGWLPLWIGGDAFTETILSYNLPIITRNLMLLAMMGLIVSAVISWRLLPPRPAHYPKAKSLFMLVQWILVPFTLIIFGALPGLDAQTRLIVGKYLGFWVTPKHRKSNA